MVIQEHFNDLVISTYGRGICILDDLSPLQQLTPQIQSSRAYFFPRAAGVSLHATSTGTTR